MTLDRLALPVVPADQWPERPLALVADEEAESRTLLGLMLENSGFEVVFSVDGREALDVIITRGPDAVVTDLDMPNLDGLALCRALRSLRATALLPVVLCSGADRSDPRVVKAVALGGISFLPKPVTAISVDAALWPAFRRGAGPSFNLSSSWRGAPSTMADPRLVPSSRAGSP